MVLRESLFAESFQCELLGQGLRPQLVQRGTAFLLPAQEQVHRPELADVPVPQIGSVRKAEHDVGVLSSGSSRGRSRYLPSMRMWDAGTQGSKS